MAGILTEDADKVKNWRPCFGERWRHGGWYVSNIEYPGGGCGCVSNNYTDKKWRIVANEKAGAFATRTHAAYAERALVLELYLNSIARRCDEAAMAGPIREDAGNLLNSLRDFSLKGVKG